jgi:hypothetical protein
MIVYPTSKEGHAVIFTSASYADGPNQWSVKESYEKVRDLIYDERRRERAGYA